MGSFYSISNSSFRIHTEFSPYAIQPARFFNRATCELQQSWEADTARVSLLTHLTGQLSQQT